MGTTGHDLPVAVTSQFLQVGRLMIEVSVWYSAIKLTPSLPRAGQEPPVTYCPEQSARWPHDCDSGR